MNPLVYIDRTIEQLVGRVAADPFRGLLTPLDTTNAFDGKIQVLNALVLAGPAFESDQAQVRSPH